jgi:hypothetical protein
VRVKVGVIVLQQLAQDKHSTFSQTSGSTASVIVSIYLGGSSSVFLRKALNFFLRSGSSSLNFLNVKLDILSFITKMIRNEISGKVFLNDHACDNYICLKM